MADRSANLNRLSRICNSSPARFSACNHRIIQLGLLLGLQVNRQAPSWGCSNLAWEEERYYSLDVA